MHVELRPVAALSAADLDRWAELGAQAREPVLFQQPEFVRPAAAHLTPSDAPLLLSVQQAPEAPLVAALCVSAAPASWFAPWPHLRAYAGPHSFSSGWLVRDEVQDAAAAAIARFISASRWRAIRLHNARIAESPLDALARAARARGGAWHALSAFERPALRLRDAQGQPLALPAWPKDLRRRLQRLTRQGPHALRVLVGQDVDEACVQRHLELEHAGWKGEQRSSMLSDPAATAFFRAMCQVQARAGRACFAELHSGEALLASSSNFFVGSTLAAFKIGWDPAAAQFSPGQVLELLLAEWVQQHRPDVALIDSNAKADSYLARLWPDRLALASGWLSFSPLARLSMLAIRPLRPLAYRLAQ